MAEPRTVFDKQRGVNVIVRGDETDKQAIARSRLLAAQTKAARSVVDRQAPEIRYASEPSAIIHRFEGVVLGGGSISYRGESQPTSGAQAVVDAVGDIGTRTTGTRVIVGAVLAGPVGALIGAVAKKKVDQRELFLTITGQRFVWIVELDPKRGADARAFAARINTEARA